MREFRVCHIEEIDDPGSLEVSLTCQGEEQNLFVIKFQGRLRGYINSCPHTGVPLNWLPDQFFDYNGELIQCALHGALFRPQDGYCVWGPCQGESLAAVPLRVEAQQIYVDCRQIRLLQPATNEH
ncbi:Rieske (2Fe-2S) protein [Thiohalophilus sp.]|uniref:Rieske (2Fe-2S) protein n=1 Tax=Thiohalophilus sp. TaxID=3028392 RepID=UPI002ACF036A|nr:Rieske 2Fe-2S domain-containing protein [Thiohalophilus sp.]MDZ7805414.1 Rieske 2Fe-2S domain-containing protein [Thiohalophilus sp.]